jgi:methylenetetrahydrofolate dehydrogenase (NADP+)/methenyltetrahydrofolate cyclohydrolase
MALEMDTFLPATPFGILTLLERYIETKGKDCVIIGRSKIVGRPMSILMGRKDFPGNSTVTLTHSYTKDEEYTKKHHHYRFRRSSFLKRRYDQGRCCNC